MRALGVWSLLALACAMGCGLSPGQDLPSANSDGESGDGDFFAPPGDGDPIVVVPPSDSGSCSSGGGGGMGGSLGTGGSPETGGDCPNTPFDR